MNSENPPPGWDNNPSSWRDRLPIIGLSVWGFLIAGYLTLFQVDVITTVWEPFFGDGSRTVLNSRFSRVLPVPDAALGAFGYLLDAVTGAVGSPHRWRRMPWIVILFGIAVGPLGLISMTLVIIQPVLLDAWCSLCLLSALVSALMIGPAMDEVLASLQFLKRVDRDRSLWRAFWGMS